MTRVIQHAEDGAIRMIEMLVEADTNGRVDPCVLPRFSGTLLCLACTPIEHVRKPFDVEIRDHDHQDVLEGCGRLRPLKPSRSVIRFQQSSVQPCVDITDRLSVIVRGASPNAVVHLRVYYGASGMSGRELSGAVQ